MSTASQKHEREVLRSIRALHPDLKVAIEKRGSGNAHKWIVASLGDQQVRLCCSSSPTVPGLWLKQMLSNARREFRKLGVDLEVAP